MPNLAPAASRLEPRLGLLLALLAGLSLYRLAALKLAGLDLYVDEAQYWIWSRHLAWGYYSKPPVIAALIAATTAVCGDGEVCVKSGALLLYPLVTLLVWAIARRLYDTRIAFWSALAFVLAPGVSFSSLIVSTDVPLFLFWGAGLYAWLRALDSDAWRWWLVLGIAGGFGLLTKYTMGIFALCAAVHLASTSRLRPHLWNPRLYAAVLLAALIFAPNLWWNAHHGWPTLHHTEDISHLATDAGLHWRSLGEFLGGQFAVMGPVFFGAWLALTLWRPRRWWADERLRLLACFSLPFLGLIALQALLGRANANWAAMTYLGATIFMTARLLAPGARAVGRWVFALGLALNFALMPLAYHFDRWTAALGIELGAKNDPYKRVRGWAELGRQAQVLQAQFPEALFLADDRETLSELIYYVHPHPFDAVLWNPRHVVDSSFAMSTTLEGKRGYNFLYVTRRSSLPPEMLASFTTAEALPPLHVTVHPDFAREYKVWHLIGFKGYAGRTEGNPVQDSVPH
jgi:hypothetical protein